MDDSNVPNHRDTFDPLVGAAESILSEVFGDRIRLTGVERLSEPGRRNLVLRCLSVNEGIFPSSFIIKKVEAEFYNPDDPSSWDSQRFFNDWIGSQFLSSLAIEAEHGPHFYGGDRNLGLIVLEDLGHHRSLVQPLLEENAASAEAALLRYSARLGKFHADTLHQYNTFETLFQDVNPAGTPFTITQQEMEQYVRNVPASLDGLGIQYESGFLREIREVVAAVTDPGPFLAYIHGDPCPDNVFDREQGEMRLIDFEFGHYGHALVDATYGRMIFPTCWCANRLPGVVVAKMEKRYRLELCRQCPQAQEDKIFEQELVTICGFWLLRTLAWHLDTALKGDQEWGRASYHQRILARLESFIAASEEFGYLPALRGTSARLLNLLAERWPETVPLPLYPAFQEISPGRLSY